MKIVTMRVVDPSQIRDAPSHWGAVIGYVWPHSTSVFDVVDPLAPHTKDDARDGWVRIVDPATWMKTHKAGWIEWGALRPAVKGIEAQGLRRFLVTIAPGQPPAIKEV